MSLVERAAKRLEELKKAGAKVAGELAYPPTERDAPASLIERAVRKTEAPAAPRVDPTSDAGAGQAEEAPTLSGDGRRPATFIRQEPRLASMVKPAPSTGEPELVLRPAPRKAPMVKLDLPGLAAGGYLEPEDPESAMANEFRKIKRPLIQACQGKLATPVANANRIMVTSSVPGEGKTFVALNLALSIAMERDSTVLLIDADTTRRSLSRLLGLGSNRGLLDLLGGKQLEVHDALLRTNVDRLSLLPAGAQRRHATELIASEEMEELVEHLASRYPDRLLIFDTPPLLGAPEPAVLASHMGQIIVVVEADKTTHKVLSNALATIESCPLVTAILNKTSSAEAGYYYYAP